MTFLKCLLLTTLSLGFLPQGTMAMETKSMDAQSDARNDTNHRLAQAIKTMIDFSLGKKVDPIALNKTLTSLSRRKKSNSRYL